MRLFPVTFLSLVLTLPVRAERKLTYHNDTTVCVEEVNQLEYLNFFTWSGKQILDFLARSEFLKEKEWKAIEMNPGLLLSIKHAADLGIKTSESMCPYNQQSTSNGTYGSDDEVDSIRHFVMSAYLSWKVGSHPARVFMAAHEDSQFANDNMMDYYNNNLGFEFGDQLREKYKSKSFMENTEEAFLADIKAEIRRKHSLPRGDAKDFLVLTSGPSVCAQRKYPNF